MYFVHAMFELLQSNVNDDNFLHCVYIVILKKLKNNTCNNCYVNCVVPFFTYNQITASEWIFHHPPLLPRPRAFAKKLPQVPKPQCTKPHTLYIFEPLKYLNLMTV